MSKIDNARSGIKARSSPISAPSAFDFSDTKRPHIKKDDNTKIYNPETGRYVDVDGKIGQKVMEKYGYPQEGGYSFNETSEDLSNTLNSLYKNLKSTWDSLWTEPVSQKRRARGDRVKGNEVNEVNEADEVRGTKIKMPKKPRVPRNARY